MPFPKRSIKTPVAIGEIRLILVDPDPRLVDEPRSGHYEVEVIYSDGSSEWERGNLLNQNTTSQNTTINNFQNAKRTQATTELLP